MAVRRFDRGELRKPTKLPNGYLRGDGFLTRIGIFQYRQPDGTTRRELRTPEEVFKADSLQSFAFSPLTNDHPPEMLTAENTREYSVGVIGPPVRDDDHVRAEVVAMDKKAIADLEAGKTQLSCGYVCDVETKPGTWNGQPYDAVQRNIRGNHVAIVDVARAGPTARIRMDALDATMVQTDESPKNPPNSGIQKEQTVKKTINGVDFEIPDQAGQALENERKAHNDALEASKKETSEAKKLADAATAKVDGLTEKVTKLEKEHKDATDPSKLSESIKARVALEKEASGVLGVKAKFDGLSDRDIKVKVLEKLSASFKADEKKDKRSDEYIQARFDQALEAFREDEDSESDLVRARRVVDGPRQDEDDDEDDGDDRQDDDEGEDHFDAEASRQKMIKQNRTAWQSKPSVETRKKASGTSR